MKKLRRSFNLTVFVLLLAFTFLVFTFYYREGTGGLTHQVQTSISAAFSYVLTPFSWVRERFAAVKNGFVTYGALKARNKELEKENKILKEKNSRLSELEKENQRLKSLLGFKEKFAYQTIAAQVIGYSPRQDEAMIIINQGSRRGIKKGLAVLSPEGLIGKVEKVYPSHSLVRLLIDRESGLSVRLVSTREVGILTADEKGNLRIRFLPSLSKVKPGDDVVTSGFSSLIPKGLYVGKVSEARQKSGSMEREVLVYSSVDFYRLEEVLVVLD